MRCLPLNPVSSIALTRPLRRWIASAALPLVLLAGAHPARAHFVMLEPSRGASNPAGAPCGAEGQDADVSSFLPGETITLEWSEYDPHPGYFRVAFSLDGSTFLPAPNVSDPPLEAGTDPSSFPQVLMADLPNADGPAPIAYSTEVTLPNVSCDDCVLQVIQVSTAGNYYQCVHLQLSEAPEPSEPSTTPPEPSEPTMAPEPEPEPEPSGAEPEPEPGSSDPEPVPGAAPEPPPLPMMPDGATADPESALQGADPPGTESASLPMATTSRASSGCSTSSLGARSVHGSLASVLGLLALALLRRPKRTAS